jgi:predicted kinase
MLIVFAGLPATGKTVLARELAAALDAVRIDKDSVRAAAFPPAVLDYSDEQNDLCMEMVYDAVSYILRRWPDKSVILDGRTYSRKGQVVRLLEVAQGLGLLPSVIECTCSDEVARKRLQAALHAHPAQDRTLSRYRALKQSADPLDVPRLRLDTGALTIIEAVALCRRYLEGGRIRCPGTSE